MIFKGNMKTLVKFYSPAKSVTEKRNLNLRNCPWFGFFRTTTVKWEMFPAHTRIPLGGTCHQGKTTPSRIVFIESHQGQGIQHHLNPSDTRGHWSWFSNKSLKPQGSPADNLNSPTTKLLCVFIHKSTTPGNSKSKQLF